MVTKQMFFDRDKVRRKADAGSRRVLGRFGAFVRTAARHGIRRRKATSAPGEPPSSRTGLLRRFIFFGYDRGRRSVVIGPERANQKAGDLLAGQASKTGAQGTFVAANVLGLQAGGVTDRIAGGIDKIERNTRPLRNAEGVSFT